MGHFIPVSHLPQFNIRDGFQKSLVLARTRTQTYTNACNRARARDLFAITQACILVIAHYLSD